MNCTRCGFANPADVKFCGRCGAALVARSCVACGFHNPLEFSFCGNCGVALVPARGEPRSYTPRHLVEKILTTRDALLGERKQVTVLFADVNESMSLAEQIGPETWHQVLDRFFAILGDGVHRFEGTINQYTGDGIMALFGAPIAHEDHAERACHAALELREALRRYGDGLRSRGLAFSVRMGLNSGEVIVGAIGDDLRMDYTAQGHTVGLAARMEQTAEPGAVYLTHHTARLVEGFFRLRELGEARVKGVHDPVRVYELEGVGAHESRFEVARARGLSRFVGREDELSSLDAALGRASAGDGQVVGVAGEAGVGKSRLCFEFLERCRARGVPVAQASGVAHGQAVPLAPIRTVMRRFFEVADGETEATVRDKVAGRMLLLTPEASALLPAVYECLGVADPDHAAAHDPEERQRELCRAVKTLVQARGRRELAVQLLEDLHWFDPMSEVVLAAYVEAVADTRSLLLVNFRSEYRADWMRKSYYQQIALRPLATGAMAELLADVAGDDPSLGALAPLVAERAQGNPFFLEEIVRSLVESGRLTGAPGRYRLAQPIDSLAVPATVQATIAARIDRLEKSAKAVLQTAAVIGREFGASLLARVAECPPLALGTLLDGLVAAEFLTERAADPERELAFKHPLTQELAYRSQLSERRASTHAAVARALEELHADRLGEIAALLAHHWEAAGKTTIAARWRRRAALRVTSIQLRRPPARL